MNTETAPRLAAPLTASINPFAAAIRGSMLGLAIGDAFGYPLEFSSQTPSHPKATEFKPSGTTFYAVPSWMGGQRQGHNLGTVALFSDDTQMAICVAEALCRMPLASAVKTAPEVTMEFLAWGRSPENTRAPGGTVMGSLHRMNGPEDWTKTNNDSKGCGTIMRSQPYGWFYGPKRARETATLHSTITHGHEAAGVSAGLYAEMISRIIRFPRIPIAKIVASVAHLASFGVGDTARKLDQVLNMVESTILAMEREEAFGYPTEAERIRLKMLDRITDRFRGWTADDALAAAVGIVLLVDEPHAAIMLAANTLGDSDSIACVVGGIVGCRAEWRQDWVDTVEKSAYLQQLASRCAKRVVEGV